MSLFLKCFSALLLSLIIFNSSKISCQTNLSTLNTFEKIMESITLDPEQNKEYTELINEISDYPSKTSEKDLLLIIDKTLNHQNLPETCCLQLKLLQEQLKNEISDYKIDKINSTSYLGLGMIVQEHCPQCDE